ncbi:uncharacterized protein LOC135389253 [Ornithodoros turicata]|uniref:uncharacterized protein LOC135389253 n=1 Tax=Ornithodoros turicata TaxID=34597 RepID=UPI0031389698
MDDHFTRWPEAVPTRDASANTVSLRLSCPVGSRVSVRVSSRIVTDRDQQSEAQVFSAFTALLVATRCRTTSYHPVSNELVERFHRQLKAAIMAYEDPTQWIDIIPLMPLGIRAALKQDLAYSSAELVYVTALRLPSDFFSPSSRTAPDPSTYASRLRRIFDGIRATPPRTPTSRPHYI